MPAQIQDALDELFQSINQFKSNTLIALEECRKSADGTYREQHSNLYGAYLEAYDTMLYQLQKVSGKYRSQRAS